MAEDDTSRIRQFILDRVNGVPVGDSEDLFASGHVNSLFAVQLVMWTEQEFGIAVERGDLDFANFRTISAIASFVARKRGAATPPPAPAGAAGDRTWTSG